MADSIHGNTELGVTKQDIIASVVQKELAFGAKLLPTVTDVSSYAVAGADTISFPKMGSFSVTNRTEGAAGDASVLTATLDTMNLSFNAYVAWIVDAKTKLQSNIMAEAELAGRAAAALGRYVDTQIIAELTSVAYVSINGGTPADITKNNVLDMIEDVEAEHANLDDCVWVITPDQRKALLKLADFSSSDVFGRPVNYTGQIGQLYGIPVVVHTGIGTTQQAFLYEKSGVAVGFQKAPSMDSQSANEYGVGAMRYAMDQMFGVKGQQIAVGSAAAGKSPLVVKLKD
jgi:HK97 family phage major capsid protein